LKAGPRQAEFEPLQQKPVKFSDVHGVDEVKEELRDVVEFLKDPTIFATLGGKLPKGVLLTGPPGTGKTMLARAVAGEAGVPFLFSSGSEFEEMFVGVGAKRVRDLFAAARKKQPAIIFIDELDAVGGKRSNRDQHYMKQTLNQLLVEMDGFLQSEGVIVIAATNFPESLDPALTRPGRFDKVIAVPLPDIRGRVQILQHHMRDITISKDADPTVLARGTSGFSGADLHNMVNQAAVQASKQGFREVTLNHFEWAKDRIIMGSERKSAYIDDKNKLMTAYHEGGHALVALYTEGAMPLHKVTCIPRGHALGYTSLLPENDRFSVSLKEYLAEIDVCMGGRVAEEIIYGADGVTSGASSDLQRATQVASAMVKNWGFSEKVGPVYYNDRDQVIAPHTRESIDAEVRNLLQAGEDRAAALLKSKEQELHRLAHALVEHETLDLEEVKKVIKGEPIRTIKEIIQEDLATMSTEPSATSAES
jgi:ATP-dependent metalloprotease